MKRTGAEILTRLLERQGVSTLSGIPGGANLPLYDALYASGIRHVLARHEQGAGFIAQGMARASGRPGVCFGTSGPGATNLVTAIADAKLDSIPLVAITGQVPSTLIGTDAFQEVDTFGITLPITKHNVLVRDVAELLDAVPRAFAFAASGRPGPVLIDVPKDVQRATLDIGRWPEPGTAAPPSGPSDEDLWRLATMIHESKRPVLYAGGGVIAAGASDALRALARRGAIPVTTTLMGLGAFPPDDPLSLGMLGMHGAGYTNRVLDEADLLIALGARFDDRATGKVSEFCPRAEIVHVDVDPSEIGKIRRPTLGIVADAGETLRVLLPLVGPDRREDWGRRVAHLRASYPLPRPDGGDPSHPLGLLEALSEALDPEAIVTTDVGQHQMWAAQVYPFRRPRSLLTSGGLGTMGFGLPAAIGASLEKPDRRVVCVTGDGSLLMNVQELATLAELGSNVTIVLLNNSHLGLVRQQQELFYGERYHASRFAHEPDFAAMARAFGIPAYRSNEGEDPTASIRHGLEAPGPALVEIRISPSENVLPMVAPGAANRDMIGERCEGIRRRA